MWGDARMRQEVRKASTEWTSRRRRSGTRERFVSTERSGAAPTLDDMQRSARE